MSTVRVAPSGPGVLVRLSTLLLLAAVPGACKDAPADDSPVEGDADADADTDSDADSDLAWSWCPGPDAWVGDTTWAGAVEVREGALYCFNFREGLALEEVPAYKAQALLIPGTWPLPVADGEHRMALPACALLADGGEGLATAGAGDFTLTSGVYAGVRYGSLQGLMPLGSLGERDWSLSARLSLFGPDGEPYGPLVVDGSGADPWGEGGAHFDLRSGEDDWGEGWRGLDACRDGVLWETQRHEVVFEGGQVELVIQIGQSAASTEPGAFVEARGELDGQAFEQTDYWRLFYTPEHHHFSRHFALLFDAPIGEACGLRVEHLDPWNEGQPGAVATVRCDLSALESRAVSSESWTRDG